MNRSSYVNIRGTSEPFNLVFDVTNAAEIKGVDVGSCIIVPNIPSISSR